MRTNSNVNVKFVGGEHLLSKASLRVILFPTVATVTPVTTVPQILITSVKNWS